MWLNPVLLAVTVIGISVTDSSFATNCVENNMQRYAMIQMDIVFYIFTSTNGKVTGPIFVDIFRLLFVA